ncbi:hypothetical protein [Acidovorax sp. NCPPB 4044]|uniref:hypothetical protein n=1 Tax=Acidovorax sp. NCPPB 4044 TaxID=2940490 RepID=UPI00230371BA|nr:hypothetical protein [Acidovorax sp. NCPPB 4044]MDA8520871.1 hypothetical protein [Acidovorax sp. NCPPB 4044]
MTMSPSSPEPVTSGHAAGSDSPASPEQKKILERIAMQRERLRSRRAAQAQTAQLRSQHAREDGSSPLDPDAPLVSRVVWFARQHPIVLVVAAGAAAAAGPSRIMRWAGILMPLIMKMKR